MRRLMIGRLAARSPSAPMSVDLAGRPEGARRLLALASAIPEHEGAAGEGDRPFLLGRIGTRAIATARSAGDALAFVGAVGVGLCRLLAGSARVRRCDLLLLVQGVGTQALPIVSLISSLVGLTLAYVGAVERQAFGAQVYLADLVGVAITRDMAVIMIGVVLAWSPRSRARIR